VTPACSPSTTLVGSPAAILRRSFGCDVLIQNRENVGFGRANNQPLSMCV
jgi:hypothetical protein